MTNEHYFSAHPESELNLRPFHAVLCGQSHQLVTAGGIFSPERIDAGTGRPATHERRAEAGDT